MRRREFFTLLGSAAATSPRPERMLSGLVDKGERDRFLPVKSYLCERLICCGFGGRQLMTLFPYMEVARAGGHLREGIDGRQRPRP